MKIQFIKKYVDISGSLYKKGTVWDIFKPVAQRLIDDKFAKAYEEQPKTVVVKSKIVTAKGGPVYVEKEVQGAGHEDDEEDQRIQGKDT